MPITLLPLLLTATMTPITRRKTKPTMSTDVYPDRVATVVVAAILTADATVIPVDATTSITTPISACLTIPTPPSP